MRLLRLLVLLLCGVLPASVPAAEPLVIHPFAANSMAELDARHAGRPYVLVLWSLSCHYCMQSLPQWGGLQARYPQVSIVLVNTDLPAEQEGMPALLRKQRLGKVVTYAFADDNVHKLRWQIDPHWRGELPRYYFFDAAHRVTAHSGLFGREAVRAELTRLADSRP